MNDDTLPPPEPFPQPPPEPVWRLSMDDLNDHSIPDVVPAELPDAIPFALPLPEEVPVVTPLWRRRRGVMDVIAVLPHPNVVFAILWWFGFLCSDLVLGIAVGVIVVAQKVQLDPALILGGAQIFHLLIAVAVVLIMYGPNLVRYLALGGFSPFHLLVVLLLVPPLHLAGAEFFSAMELLLRRVLELFKINVPIQGPGLIMDPLLQLGWPAAILIIAVLPGFAEELFFRGFLGRGLVGNHGVALGLALATVAFAVMHIAPPQVAFTFILGLGIHIVYLTTKSLWPAIVLHIANNALACILYAAVEEPAKVVPWLKFWREGNSQLPPLVVVASFFAAGTLLWLFYASRSQWLMPDGRPWSPGYVTAEAPPAEVGAVREMLLPGLGVVMLAMIAYAAFIAAMIWETWALW